MNQHIPRFETFGKFGKFGNSTTLQANDHIFSLFLTVQLYSDNESAFSVFRGRWKVLKIWQLYNSTGKLPYTHFLSLSNFTILQWEWTNSTGKMGQYIHIFKKFGKFSFLQLYIDLKPCNQFFDCKLLIKLLKDSSLNQLYTSTWHLRLCIQFLDRNCFILHQKHGKISSYLHIYREKPTVFNFLIVLNM